MSLRSVFVGAFLLPVVCDSNKSTTGVCDKIVAGTILSISSIFGGVGLAVRLRVLCGLDTVGEQRRVYW